MSAILRIENMNKVYGEKPNETVAIDNMDMSIHKNDFVAIMGPSGSGKSSLLNCIATIDNVSSGHIYIDGKDLAKIDKKNLAKFRREELGFIFQDFNLIDTLSVYDNIALALTINHTNRANIDRIVKDVTEQLGIRDILTKFPYQISGGQKQRCACARAIINQPNLILADEPTGALDSNSSNRLLKILQYMNQDMGATILMVTHDAMAASYTNRTFFLNDGKIVGEIGKHNENFYHEIVEFMTAIGGN